MKLKKKPKIAILSIKNEYNYGGVFATLKIVYQFCQQYFDPTIFVLGFDKKISSYLKGLKFTSKNRSINFAGMNCIEVGARWSFWEPGHYKFTQKQWEEALKDFDYVFVVSATPIAGHPAALLNKKYVIWISTSYTHDRAQRVQELKGIRALINRLAEPRMKKIEKTILQKASYIYPLSSYSQSQFEEAQGKLLSDYLITGYPLDFSKIKYTAQTQEKNIITVGRFNDPRKNIDMLIKSFEIICTKIPTARLFVIGQRPSAETLKKYRNLPCFKNITFTGVVAPRDLKHFYKQARLMLITSHQEGFGIAGLEALAYGIPVISTDCGGPRDYVIDGQTGYLVDVNDYKNMAVKSLRILSSDKTYQKLSKNAFDYSRQHFSLTAIHNNFKTGIIHTYPELTSLLKLEKIKTKNKQGRYYESTRH